MKYEELILSVDCSTTAAKAVVWDLSGNAIAIGKREFGLSHVKSGWIEQNSSDWWEATAGAICDAAKMVDPSKIKGLAVTHQRETFVCLNSNGNAIRPAITWMDIRATEEVTQYGNTSVHRKTGKPPNPTPAWYKLLLLKKHEPETIKKTDKIVDVGGYLLHQLTGNWVTSWASADPLGLIDLSNFDYDDDLLEIAEINLEQVPSLLAPGKSAGELKPEVAEQIGLTSGIPVFVGAGDGQSAGLGCNVTTKGKAYLNLGTGAVSGVYSDTYNYDTAYRTMSGPIPGTYIFETFIGGGTQNVVWFVENLSNLNKSKEEKSPEQILEELASKVPPGSQGLLCLPYWTGAMTPYWDGHARGAFVGLSGVHTKGHLYRSVLEGIALEQRLLMEGVENATTDRIDEIFMLGGGSNSPLWCQIISDVLGRGVKLVAEQESTALGAGIHAATSLKFFSDHQAAAKAMTGIKGDYQPQNKNSEYYSKLFTVYKSIYPNLKDTYQLLSEIPS